MIYCFLPRAILRSDGIFVEGLRKLPSALLPLLGLLPESSSINISCFIVIVFLIMIAIKPLINFNGLLKFSFWRSIDWGEMRVGIRREVWGPSQKSRTYMLPARKRRVEFEKERARGFEGTWEVKRRGLGDR